MLTFKLEGISGDPKIPNGLWLPLDEGGGQAKQSKDAQRGALLQVRSSRIFRARRAADVPAVLIAGGIGITPLFALARAALTTQGSSGWPIRSGRAYRARSRSAGIRIVMIAGDYANRLSECITR